MEIKKVDAEKIKEDKRNRVDELDVFRDGKSMDLDGIVVSASLADLIVAVNKLIDEVKKHEGVLTVLTAKKLIKK